MDDNRCPNCGRKQPCEPCTRKEAERREDARLDALHAPDRGYLLVYFSAAPALAQQHLNRLRAEWPGAVREEAPDQWRDYWSGCCRIARMRSELDGECVATYEVREDGALDRLDDFGDDFWAAFSKLNEQGS